MGEDLRRSRSGHEDRISSLPDELLHDILEHLHCARAAARTSVLSRRWRHLWRYMPELNLVAPPATILDTVESALAGYSAPTLEILRISVWPDDPKYRFRVAAERVARWLRFAVEHGVEYLRLNVPLGIVEPEVNGEEEAVLELPVLQRAKKICLILGHRCQLRLREPGLFTALTYLVVEGGRMEGAELTAVCTQCPRLRYINLFLKLIAVSDVSVHSNSLESMRLDVRNTRRLEVVAPNLENLRVYYATEAYISAPKLAKLGWLADVYDPQHHRFAGIIGRCLQQLEISQRSLIASLIRQFDEVDELKLQIYISILDLAGYESFLNDTNKLPKCKTLRISLSSGDHGLLPIILHLLRTCNSIKKYAIRLQEGSCSWDPSLSLGYCCPPSCPCRLQESQKIDSSALSSLEEVELSGFTNCLQKLELVEFLSCNATNLKRLVIEYMVLPNPPQNIKEVCEKVRSICHPNVKVEFYLYHFLSPIPVD